MPDAPPPSDESRVKDIGDDLWRFYFTAWYAVNADRSSAFYFKPPYRANGPVEEWAVEDPKDYIFDAEKLTLLPTLIGTDWNDGAVEVTIDIKVKAADIIQAKEIGRKRRDMLDKLSKLPD